MSQFYLPIGTRVRVRETAEVMAGELAYIVEVEPETSHPYCVHKKKTTDNVANSHWLKTTDVVPTLPYKAFEAPKLVQDVRKSIRMGLQVGRKVVVSPLVPFGTRIGYVLALDNDSVLLSSDPELKKAGNIWIKRKYVNLA